MPTIDEERMLVALGLAREAEARGEVPIGAIVVDADGSVVGTGSNETIGSVDPTAHAEVLALRAAAKHIGNYRLSGCVVYTTIEPCAMCAGALVNARISRLVYGARDERFGAVATHFRICDSEALNHRMQVAGGVLEQECRSLIQEFFRKRRTKASGLP